MSTMKYTYIGTRKAKILSDLKGGASTTGKPLDLKGKIVDVDEYDFTVSGRGNPQGTTTKTYFLESSRENSMGMPPTTQFPKFGGNPFQEISIEDFEYVDEGSTMPSNDEDANEPSNNKTIMWLGLIVLGYFAYKYYNKK